MTHLSPDMAGNNPAAEPLRIPTGPSMNREGVGVGQIAQVVSNALEPRFREGEDRLNTVEMALGEVGEWAQGMLQQVWDAMKGLDERLRVVEGMGVRLLAGQGVTGVDSGVWRGYVVAEAVRLGVSPGELVAARKKVVGDDRVDEASGEG